MRRRARRRRAPEAETFDGDFIVAPEIRVAGSDWGELAVDGCFVRGPIELLLQIEVLQNGKTVPVHLSPGDSSSYKPGSVEIGDQVSDDSASAAELDIIFSHHPPVTEERRVGHETVRGEFRRLAYQLVQLVPAGPEQKDMIHHLDYACRAANAGIARRSNP
jgi:hypothetical protein